MKLVDVSEIKSGMWCVRYVRWADRKADAGGGRVLGRFDIFCCDHAELDEVGARRLYYKSPMLHRLMNTRGGKDSPIELRDGSLGVSTNGLPCNPRGDKEMFSMSYHKKKYYFT